MKIRHLFLVLCLVLGVSFAHAGTRKGVPQIGTMEGPEVGQPAPDFALPWADAKDAHYAEGEWMKLSSLKGSNVIIAFYPMDFSSGCTKEVCSFRDGLADLQKLKAKLIGISGDYIFSHKQFAETYKLEFPLLSDHDHAVGKMYASYAPMLGGINKRTIYLVDKNGIIRYKNLKFRAEAKEDYDALKAALVKLDADEGK